MSGSPDVTREDQEQINKFGRLNLRLHELEEEIATAKRELQTLDDASQELVLIDGDDSVRFAMAEVFFELETDEADTKLEAAQEELSEQIEIAEAELDAIKNTQAELKVKLYGKFGEAINLEEDK